MKYIDADKLKAEIERRKKEHMYDEMPITIGRYYEDRDLLAFIDFDLQEQPEVDLEKEIDRLWESFADEMEGPHNLFDIYSRLARHFFDLGRLNARKEE